MLWKFLEIDHSVLDYYILTVKKSHHTDAKKMHWLNAGPLCTICQF